MSRLKKANESGILSLPQNKIAYSFMDLLKEMDPYEFLNLVTEEEVEIIIRSKDSDSIVKVFLEQGGLKKLFEYVEEFYGFNDSYNEEIEEYLSYSVKNWDRLSTRTPYEMVKDILNEAIKM